MKESKTLVVDDKTYIVSHYSPTKGRKLAWKLGNILSGSLGVIQSKLDDNIENAISEIVQPIFEKLDPDEFDALFQEVLSTTEIKENNQIRPINWQLDFMGEYMHQAKLLVEVLKFQFSDFFAGVGAITAVKKQKPTTKKKIKAK